MKKNYYFFLNVHNGETRRIAQLLTEHEIPWKQVEIKNACPAVLPKDWQAKIDEGSAVVGFNDTTFYDVIWGSDLTILSSPIEDTLRLLDLPPTSWDVALSLLAKGGMKRLIKRGCPSSLIRKAMEFDWEAKGVCLDEQRECFMVLHNHLICSEHLAVIKDYAADRKMEIERKATQLQRCQIICERYFQEQRWRNILIYSDDFCYYAGFEDICMELTKELKNPEYAPNPFTLSQRTFVLENATPEQKDKVAEIVKRMAKDKKYVNNCCEAEF